MISWVHAVKLVLLKKKKKKKPCFLFCKGLVVTIGQKTVTFQVHSLCSTKANFDTISTEFHSKLQHQWKPNTVIISLPDQGVLLRSGEDLELDFHFIRPKAMEVPSWPASFGLVPSSTQSTSRISHLEHPAGSLLPTDAGAVCWAPYKVLGLCRGRVVLFPIMVRTGKSLCPEPNVPNTVLHPRAVCCREPRQPKHLHRASGWWHTPAACHRAKSNRKTQIHLCPSSKKTLFHFFKSARFQI